MPPPLKSRSGDPLPGWHRALVVVRPLTFWALAAISSGCLELPRELPAESAADAADMQTRRDGDASRDVDTGNVAPDSDSGSPPARWRSVSVGDFHACGITGNDKLICWGDNGNSQISATLDNLIATPPTRVDGRYKHVAAGRSHTCAVTVDNFIYCWGENADGLVGPNAVDDEVGPTRPFAEPLAALEDDTGKVLSAGRNHTCALVGDREEPSAVCWGTADAMNAGALGEVPGEPITLTSLPSSAQIAVGRNVSCALVERGSSDGGAPSDPLVRCWGGEGVLTAPAGCDGDCLNPEITADPGAASLTGLRLAQYHACVFGDGLWCWGSNSYERIAEGEDDPLPLFDLGTGPDDVALGGDGHTCILENGSIRCLGRDNAAQAPPNGPSVMARFEEIAAGLFNTCGITEAGRLYCWGGNSTGVLPGVSDLDHGPVEIVVPDPN